jgi:L-fucose isomerase-like protein
MVVGIGEVLSHDMAFTGTSGVVRFERHTKDVLADVIASGLEHHMVLAYGDHQADILETAGALDLDVVEL